jgi:DNA-binding transcriptional LysR family regulator
MDIRSLDLNLLLVFDALLRTRSVTVAAEQTGMRQSSMSGALKRLRTALEDPLFVKCGSGMAPTALALELAGPVQAGLAQIKGALAAREAFDPATSERRFVLYMSDTAQLVFLPSLLEVIRREAPGVEIRTRQCDIRQANRMMAEGGIDLAAGFFLSIDDSLHRSTLFESPYAIIASTAHPSIQGSCTLEQLAAAPHLVYRPAVGSHRAIDERIFELLAQFAKTRRRVLEVSHGLGLAEVVARTDLVACIPRPLAELCARGNRVQVLPLPATMPTMTIAQYWHERVHRDGGSMWLRGLMRRLFRESWHNDHAAVDSASDFSHIRS